MGLLLTNPFAATKLVNINVNSDFVGYSARSLDKPPFKTAGDWCNLILGTASMILLTSTTSMFGAPAKAGEDAEKGGKAAPAPAAAAPAAAAPAVKQEPVPALSQALWQRVAYAVVLEHCTGTVTSTTTLEEFEADLPDPYKITTSTPNSIQKEVSVLTGALLAAAKEGVQPSEYYLVLQEYAPLANNNVAVRLQAAAPATVPSAAAPAPGGIGDTPGKTAAPAPATTDPASQAKALTIAPTDLAKADSDLAAAAKDVQTNPVGTAEAQDAASNIGDASTILNGVGKPTVPGVDHYFVSVGYQVANPYAFVPSASTSTDPNGSIKPNTTYGVLLEFDYLNRLAWDPQRWQYLSADKFMGSPDSGILKLWNFKNWDIETRLFYALTSSSSSPTGTTSGSSTTTGSATGSTTTNSSTTTSSGPDVSATSLVGSGNFGAEVAIGQNFWITNDDPLNFQTFGFEERFGGVSDRTSYRNHAEEFVGVNYSIGYKTDATSAEAIRANFRAGLDWLDAVSFTNPYSATSTEIYTLNGAPSYSQRQYSTIQSEVLLPIGTNSYVLVGGRVYFGTTRPAPWTSYVGYTIDLSSVAQALHIGGSSSTTSKTSGDTTSNPSK